MNGIIAERRADLGHAPGGGDASQRVDATHAAPSLRDSGLQLNDQLRSFHVPTA
jgi:hypothetical protein